MAVKLTNHNTGTQLLFPNHRSAREYAEDFGGGAQQWEFTEFTDREAIPWQVPVVEAPLIPQQRRRDG